MTKEENIKLITDFIKMNDILEHFCDKVVKEYRKYDYLKHDVYPSVESYKVDEGCIDIKTEDDDDDFAAMHTRVPIEVFYENNVEEYVKNLYEQRAAMEEAKKKAKGDREKQRAIEEIQRLKEKYNL